MTDLHRRFQVYETCEMLLLQSAVNEHRATITVCRHIIEGNPLRSIRTSTPAEQPPFIGDLRSIISTVSRLDATQSQLTCQALIVNK